jgi:hypothetical protein
LSTSVTAYGDSRFCTATQLIFSLGTPDLFLGTANCTHSPHNLPSQPLDPHRGRSEYEKSVVPILEDYRNVLFTCSFS